MESIEKRLTGGHSNSLGNTVGVVEDVLKETKLFDELFNCYHSKDAVVRLRVSNAMKRITKTDKALVIPYVDRLLNEISKIDQASTQWTLSQLFLLLTEDLNQGQYNQALEIMKYNILYHNDWIVLNETMRTLKQWSVNDPALQEWLKSALQRLANDPRKSVANRAKKYLNEI